ncbi:PREDICTED: mitogen-activated protein kinase kinase kinase kinase 4-like, partial [Galeopterus variegatus]|uniref:non-specific serine/threonine protein kinase n=1 Tax=Galeopterus variegatus TaxID=482537 RepID=A0ABM0Q0M3_GALVR
MACASVSQEDHSRFNSEILCAAFWVKYERIKFLVIALKSSVEVYAWAPKPCHKFMAFQSFGELVHKPLLVDLTVEEGQRLKVIYGSCAGFHAVDVDSGSVYDIYLSTHIRKNPHPIQCSIKPHVDIILPNTDGMELLVCYEDEGCERDNQNCPRGRNGQLQSLATPVPLKDIEDLRSLRCPPASACLRVDGA